MERLRVAAALGVTRDVVDRAEALVNAGVDAVIIDTAHGHTKTVVAALKSVKSKIPNTRCYCWKHCNCRSSKVFS